MIFAAGCQVFVWRRGRVVDGGRSGGAVMLTVETVL
jgi:hypothetical protein